MQILVLLYKIFKTISTNLEYLFENVLQCRLLPIKKDVNEPRLVVLFRYLVLLQFFFMHLQFVFALFFAIVGSCSYRFALTVLAQINYRTYGTILCKNEKSCAPSIKKGVNAPRLVVFFVVYFANAFFTNVGTALGKISRLC